MNTFGELKSQLEMELDLESEDFIQDEEMMGYYNSAVTMVESEIVKLGLREQYLKTSTLISVVSGTKDYSLPANLIADKIRKIIYRNGTLIYTVPPLKGEGAFELEDELEAESTSSEEYSYALYKTSEDHLLRLIPTPNLSVTDAIRLIYFKKLNRFTDEDDNCDVPDICYEYIQAFVRYRCFKKESHANLPVESAELVAMRTLMGETLQNQVADPDMDMIDSDLSAYKEMN